MFALEIKEGTVQACITSAAVTRIRISVLQGITARLSTSKSRNWPSAKSSVGSIYASKSKSKKSEYSYLQYHWWPIVLTVRDGCSRSSNKYNKQREGRARKINTVARIIAHTDSSLLVCRMLLTL